MPGKAKRRTRMVMIAFLPLIALVLLERRAHAQQPLLKVLDSSPDPALDPITRIERKLRRLKATNDRLQTECDELSHQYEEFLQHSAHPVFGRSQEKSASTSILHGLNLLPASFLQKQEQIRAQISEGEVRENTGSKKGIFELEEAVEEEGEEAPPLEPPTPQRRRQTGLSGAGEVIEPVTPSLMANYVDERGPYQPDMRPSSRAATVSFREGLQLGTVDGFLSLEFHNLTQLDYREFSQTGAALHDNFIIPRQRWYFQGQLSPYVYYYTVINRGYGSLNLLDAWADFNFAPAYKQQLQFRVGRMKTPFTYEYIKISDSDLATPERSLFVSNFADNRELGVMAHGYLFQNSMEYYGGIFNGPRRSFQGFDNGKALLGLVNFKPFLHSGIEWLEQLNLTGSVNGGSVRATTQPTALTTANDQSPVASASIVNVSPTFFIFDPKTFENGSFMEWGADVAYYYKSFTLLANYQGGFQNYSLQGPGTLPSATVFGPFASAAFVGVGNSHRTAVPLTGWSVTASYFVTGEQITRRVYLTEPRRPFGYYNGRLNPGAIEVYSRFANFQLGDQVFSGGFANPAYWANRVSTTDTGINWYLNPYVRLYFDWQHAFYNQPVFMSDDKSSRHNDLYWFRLKLFY